MLAVNVMTHTEEDLLRSLLRQRNGNTWEKTPEDQCISTVKDLSCLAGRREGRDSNDNLLRGLRLSWLVDCEQRREGEGNWREFIGSCYQSSDGKTCKNCGARWGFSRRFLV